MKNKNLRNRMKIKNLIKEKEPKFTEFYFIIISLLISLIISSIYYSENIFGIEDKYKEFILGDTIFLNYNKLVDSRVIFLFMIIFLITIVIIYKIYKPRGIDFEQLNIKKNNLFFGVVVVFIISLVFKNNFDFLNFKYYIIPFSLYISIMYFIFNIKEIKSVKIRYIKEIVFIAIFSWLSSSILEYFLLEFFNLEIRNYIFFVPIILLSGVKINSSGLYISQIFIPLFFLKLLENKYYYNNEIIHLHNNNNLKILVILLIIFCFAFNVIEYKKNKNEGILFSSVIVIMFLFIWNNVPAIYNLDEYHIGELFTNYDQIINKGQMPYKEYIPVKGYFHLIIGFINEAFYNGGYNNISRAYQLNNLIFMIPILFILKSILTKENIILIIILNLIPLPGSYYLIIPALFILTRESIIENEYNFILSYYYICFTSFMYYQSFGIAIGIGLFPFLLVKVYSIIKNKIYPNRNIVYYLILGIILGILNLKPIFYGLKYSLINLSANTFYWGNQSIYSESEKISSAFKFFKSHLWAVIVMFSVLSLIKKYKKMLGADKLLHSFIIFFPLSILSYVTGRLDVIMKRPNNFSLMIISLLLILFLYKYEKEHSNLNLIGLITIMGTYFLFSNQIPILSLPSLNMEIVHNIPETMIIIDREKHPKYGNGFIDKGRFLDLTSEQKLFDEACLNDNDTFLMIDPYLTDSARYSLFGYKIPTLSHSVLNIPSISSQKWELERVRNFNVPILRISPGINRYYLFHKEFLNSDYIYTTYNNREYLIKKDIFESMKMKFNLEENILPESYSMRDAGVLPIKWGNSFESNKEKILKSNIVLNPKGYNNIKYENGSNYILKEEDPYIIFNFDNVDINSKTDFIKFNLRSNEDKVLQMQLFWADSSQIFSEENSIRFNARNGDIVIPVGFNLGWRNMEKAEYLRFDIDGLEKGKEFEISNVEFLSLDSN